MAAPAVRGLSYVAAVVRRLASNFPGASLGADLTIASDLPKAAGLSSSSALVVGVAAALARRGALEERAEWRVAIRSPYDLAAYLGAVERGSAFDGLAGTSAVGVFGGSEDHTAILTCRAGLLSACRYIPIRPLDDVRLPADWRFVIGTSGVEADKAGSARGLYNRASLAAEALVCLWNEQTGRADETLAGALAAAPDVARQLLAVAESSRLEEFSPELLTRRLAHFIAEDGRVPEAVHALRAADWRGVGDLASASQADAERLLQNQTEETSTLARLAPALGAFASSSFGAGFGGSVWALVPAEDAQAFAGRWIASYRRSYPRLERASAFDARPGPAMFEWTG
jgi:galactokinase